MTTTYSGELRTEATHLRSGQTIITDAPLDNKGKGEAFSPTDLVCVALGSCMLTIMDQAAQAHGFSIAGSSIKTTKVMAADPRRIFEIVLEFDMGPQAYTDKQKNLLLVAARNCPVAKSIHPDIVVKTQFHYH